jgi:choline dehydrogenase-like flavoprotein
MILDARHLAPHPVETDLCIVGAGPAGLTLASCFEASPVRVCVLESGGLEPDAGTQALARAENAGLPYYPLDGNRRRAFGGSLHLWAGWCRPLDEIDFTARPWVPDSGWPLQRDDLLPYYGRAHVTLGIREHAYGVEVWETARRAARLRFASNDLDTRIYQLAEPAFLLRTARPALERSQTIAVHLHATAIELRTDTSGRLVTAAAVGTLDGQRYSVRARHYVLAAGGVENARLLLLSNPPHGLGNDHDLVGRCFMEHLHFPDATLALTGRGIAGSLPYVAPGGSVAARLYPPPSVQGREQILNCNAMLDAAPAGFRHRVLAALGRPLPGRAPGHPTGRTDRLVLSYTLEQAPNRSSRVLLSHERDALGMNRVKLDWRTSDLDQLTTDRFRALLARAFRDAGLGVLRPARGDEWPPPPLQGLRGHHMGTTRMHTDAHCGVVDPDCRVHGIDNLFVAGSSVFPASGAGTPTVTIVALAHRLGDRLKSMFSRPS